MSNGQLSFPTRGSWPWVLPPSLLAEWSTLYPYLNVQHEVMRALAWVQVNPARRKTARGMPRFLVAWLNRSANEYWKQQKRPRYAQLSGPLNSEDRLAYEQWRQHGCPHTPRCPHFSACQLVSSRKQSCLV